MHTQPPEPHDPPRQAPTMPWNARLRKDYQKIASIVTNPALLTKQQRCSRLPQNRSIVANLGAMYQNVAIEPAQHTPISNMNCIGPVIANPV
jgi:hypothetical protein